MSAIEPVRVAKPPVIILGMHRSGTSLAARMLDELGLFQGNEVLGNHESAWFLGLNEQLFRRVNAAWDRPAGFADFLAQPAAVELAIRCLADDVTGRHISGFLGLPRFLKYRSLARFDLPWGWKDPRTIYTLPLWLRLFPTAKLIYITRHGVDVAASLRARERQELARRIKEFDAKRTRLASHLLVERGAFKGSARCLELAGGFSLWEEYVAAAESNLAAAGNDRRVVRYETLLESPESVLADLAAFAGLAAKAGQIKTLAAGVDPDRRHAFDRDDELKAFHHQVKDSPWMAAYGYNP